MKTLLIVESPNKAKKIRAYFPEFEVMATVGHFMDLPSDSMGVEPPEHKPMLVVTSGKQGFVSKMRAAAKAADVVYVATDPDREGEAIASHVVNTLGKVCAGKISRITYVEVSKLAIQKAIATKRGVNWSLVRAQEARRVLDRYVGYQVSPALSEKFKLLGVSGRLSAGRVQSVTVRLVVERKEEIDAFCPVQHFGVRAVLIKSGGEFEATWKPRVDAGELITDVTEAKAVAARTHSLELVQSSNQGRKVPAPKPLITTTYVRLVAASLGLTTKECMDAAQKLFEQGLITYHRTDSPAMSEDFTENVRSFAVQRSLPIPTEARKFAPSANAQEGHECLRVADINLINAGEAGITDKTLVEVYRLVWLVTLQSQLLDGEDRILVHTLENAHKDLFVSRTKSVSRAGWRTAYTAYPQSGETKLATSTLDHDEEKEVSWASVPELTVGEALTPISVTVETKVTEPPAAYTETTLVQKLEKLGVGRPSTYASTIERIISAGYVERTGKHKRFDPLARGKAIVHALKPAFSFMDHNYTARLEDQFDLIAQSKAAYLDVVKSAWEALQEELVTFENAALPSKTQEEARGIGSSIKANSPRKEQKKAGSSSTGSNSRTQKTDSAKSSKVSGKTQGTTQTSSPGDKCPKCINGVLAITAFKAGSNAGREFVGCSLFPTCRFFQWVQ